MSLGSFVVTMQNQFRLFILGLIAGATFGLVWGSAKAEDEEHLQ